MGRGYISEGLPDEGRKKGERATRSWRVGVQDVQGVGMGMGWEKPEAEAETTADSEIWDADAERLVCVSHLGAHGSRLASGLTQAARGAEIINPGASRAHSIRTPFTERGSRPMQPRQTRRQTQA